jgi:tellurite resistance protein TehA-like permease
MLQGNGVPAAHPSVIGAAVMGTGIVSVALRLDGVALGADALMWVACGLWAALVLSLAATARAGRLAAHAARPDSLTAVAATCVVGTRVTLQGFRWAGVALLVCGALAWPPWLACVLCHWRRPRRGHGFLAAVSAEAVAVLCATVGAAVGAPWLAVAAAVALVAGLGLYGFAASSFDPAQLAKGEGDQWIAGGALAIAALAAASAAGAIRAADALGWLREPLTAVAMILWWLAIAWLPPLVLAEVRHRRLRWGSARWATVFPLGMYAVMSFAVGTVAGHRWIAAFARGWTWVAFAAWALLAVASVSRGGHG